MIDINKKEEKRLTLWSYSNPLTRERSAFYRSGRYRSRGKVIAIFKIKK